MSRANRKREPEQWPRLVNLGLGVVLAGVVAYQLFAPSLTNSRTAGGPKLANGDPGAPLAALPPGLGGSALPEGRRDPFTPLPQGATATPGTPAVPGQPGTDATTATAPGMAGLPEPQLGVEAGNRRRGADRIWIPPNLDPLPPVTSASGGATQPETLTPVLPPDSQPVSVSNGSQESDDEMVMLPTRLLEARGGKARTARFQYGGEMLTRRQGDYLGTYRVERVDHDAIILIDSKKRRVRLLTGESVNGTPTPPSAPAPPIRAVVPRSPRVAATTPPASAPPASPAPAPRVSANTVERSVSTGAPVPMSAPLPTVKGSGRETSTPPTRPEAVPNPPNAAPPPSSRPTATEASRPVRNNAPVEPAEGPLPLTRK